MKISFDRKHDDNKDYTCEMWIGGIALYRYAAVNTRDNFVAALFYFKESALNYIGSLELSLRNDYKVIQIQ